MKLFHGQSTIYFEGMVKVIVDFISGNDKCDFHYFR